MIGGDAETALPTAPGEIRIPLVIRGSPSFGSPWQSFRASDSVAEVVHTA